MIISKVTKNQGLVFSLENTILEKSQWEVKMISPQPFKGSDKWGVQKSTKNHKEQSFASNYFIFF